MRQSRASSAPLTSSRKPKVPSCCSSKVSGNRQRRLGDALRDSGPGSPYSLIVPFVELCTPGQPAPDSEFPFIALAIGAAAAVIAFLVVHRHPRTGAGGGRGRPVT